MYDYEEVKQRWHLLVNSLIKPKVNTKFYWVKYYYEHISKNIGKIIIEDYCNLRIWIVDKSAIVLLSQNNSFDNVGITSGSHHIATAVHHAFGLGHYQNIRFFESYEHDIINNAPYFHEIKYSVKYIQSELFFYDPEWINATNEFINILSKGMNNE